MAPLSHLETAFPAFPTMNRTQVVDFPHLAMVRLFWEEGFHRRDGSDARVGTESQEEEPGTNQRGLGSPSGRATVGRAATAMSGSKM